MQFARLGMNDAQPVFPVDGSLTRAKEILGYKTASQGQRYTAIPAPNAAFIAASPAIVAALLDEVERQGKKLQETQEELVELQLRYDALSEVQP
jgi:hypothetical protein